MTTMTRSYSGMALLETFEERYDYLRLQALVGATTFGFDRHLNQGLYRSSEWRNARRIAILRDDGCDLGIEGYEIHGELLVHHINPVTSEDIEYGADSLFDTDNLITTTKKTHNAIHYGDSTLLRIPFVERAPGDTQLW